MHGEIEKKFEASGMAFTHLRAGESLPRIFGECRQFLPVSAEKTLVHFYLL
jgi:hypothetical protein